MNHPAPTIVMADDHAIVRTGFRALIEEAACYRIVAECSTTCDARDAVAALSPDILVLDISLPGGGLDFLPEVRLTNPDTRVLILSMHVHQSFLTKALQLGATGYVSKGSAAEELISALDAVRAGDIYVSADLRSSDSLAAPGEFLQLTEREHDVFFRLAKGHTPKQAALELGISVKTVYVHRASIREKLVVRSDLQLHQLALSHGIL